MGSGLRRNSHPVGTNAIFSPLELVDQSFVSLRTKIVAVAQQHTAFVTPIWGAATRPQKALSAQITDVDGILVPGIVFGEIGHTRRC